MAGYVVENNAEEKSHKKPLFKDFNLKKFGNLKALILIFVLLVVAVILYNYSGAKTTSNKEPSSEIGYTTSLDYINQIEDKLITIIGGIKGAGKVNVMISIDSSPELLVAENIEEKTVTTSSGTTTTKVTEPIIVKNNGEDSPLILKETLPSINGVIVVSSGANDTKVRLDIINAVSMALGINLNKIEVFVGS